MELKVWVDGIKRVVCGVTDNTTCQDIVIALAQAMGRTGRFTLMEIWRDNERPLPPSECPLLVLQKWGEFANEVKLVLYESGSRRRQKHSEKEKEESKKPPDRFTHNFTPPVKTSDAVIRRSLTFSGGRKNDTVNNIYTKPVHPDSKQHIDHHGAFAGGENKTKHLLSVPERGTSERHSFSSTSSRSSQNSTAIHQQHQRQRSTSRERSIPNHNNGPASLPTYPVQQSSDNRDRQNFQNHQLPQHHKNFPNSGHYENPSVHQHSQPNRPHFPPPLQDQIVPSYNGPVKPTNRPGHVASVPQIYSSAFSVVRPRSGGPESEQNSLKLHNNTDIPVYTDLKPSSRKSHNLEEYDLDSNFPDVVKETGRDHLIEEYHVPGQQGQGQHHHSNHFNMEEEERVKLLRLVTMQNERIKMQDSNLELIETGLLLPTFLSC